jgi:hypothetical protein
MSLFAITDHSLTRVLFGAAVCHLPRAPEVSPHRHIHKGKIAFDGTAMRSALAV